MMEIKTCEQYVLAQLFGQQDENERILMENDRLRKEIESIKGEMEAIQADCRLPIQEAIRNVGRKILMQRCVGYGTDVKDDDDVKSFADWCFESVSGYSLPIGVSVLTFIKEFEPELREYYDRRVGELSDGN